MNFRQRISWLLVALFLFLSFVIVYYLFEISDQYNSFALTHISKFESDLSKDPNSVTIEQSVKRKLFSLPFWAWLIILLLPYLQIFCLLVACTKNDPMNATVMVVPCFLCLRIANWNSNGQKSTVVEVAAVESGKQLLSNGHSTLNP
ncbi:hypothetical protein HOLleu_08040 [Holothuria leucospilota]|uniref:Lysosomal enzyme trafficking factor n=1 Tax=Holothuria leucospilota TaxID=206669 RepID=A0A9Q1CGX8_HOLLE|nr:hypothetical protein HOLleu_08040 [Holothuria leucospilota]